MNEYSDVSHLFSNFSEVEQFFCLLSYICLNIKYVFGCKFSPGVQQKRFLNVSALLVIELYAVNCLIALNVCIFCMVFFYSLVLVMF